MKYLLLVFLTLLASPLAQAQVLSSYKVSSPDPYLLKTLSQLFEIESRIGNDYEVILPAEQTALLRALAPQAQLIHADITASINARLKEIQLSNAFQPSQYRYHELSEVQQWMKDLETKFPQNVKVIQYGTSERDRPLLALRITKDVSAADAPALMITAATHGDELITVEVLMSLINQLMDNYGKDPRFTQMVDTHNIYFVPVLNVDGFASRTRYDGNKDPNRSYPYPENLTNKPTASIAGIMQFFSEHEIIGSIDFHAYGEMIMYPWAYTHDPIDPVYGNKLNAMTKHMADTNHYAYGPISDVIYIAPGSSCDYYFWTKKTLSLGIEMGEQKVPDPSSFPEYIQAQADSTWRFIESF